MNSLFSDMGPKSVGNYTAEQVIWSQIHGWQSGAGCLGRDELEKEWWRLFCSTYICKCHNREQRINK